MVAVEREASAIGIAQLSRSIRMGMPDLPIVRPHGAPRHCCFSYRRSVRIFGGLCSPPRRISLWLRRRQLSIAFCSTARSIFFICSIAFMAFCALALSGWVSASINCAGTICQESP